MEQRTIWRAAWPVASLLGALPLTLPLAAWAGAWPRDDGRTFLSFGTEVTDGATSARGFTGLYAERGLPRRWTAVLDAGVDRDGADWTVALALRRPMDDGTGPNRFALSMGVGLAVEDERALTDVPGLGQARPFGRAGAHWGRGIQTAWGDGWLATDALVDVTIPIVAGDDPDMAWKLDATLGLRPAEGLATILQLQAGAPFAGDDYLRLQASVVRDLGPVARVEAGVIAGLSGDDTQALKLGVWLEF